MHRMTLSPVSIAARVFLATSSEVSWKRVRLSEWPGGWRVNKNTGLNVVF